MTGGGAQLCVPSGRILRTPEHAAAGLGLAGPRAQRGSEATPCAVWAGHKAASAAFVGYALRLWQMASDGTNREERVNRAAAELKETEDLLAGFDRPGRTPRTPPVKRDFVDYHL